MTGTLGASLSAGLAGKSRCGEPVRSLRAALENASRFLSSAPLRVRIPPFAHKKAPWADESSGRSVTLAGLRRLTANTSMYALPCGFAVVGESPRLAR